MRKLILMLFMLPALLAPPAAVTGDTILVLPDGSGDYPTIQAAIDAAVTGDVIALGAGTFRGEGNKNLDFAGKSITVGAQSGTAADCVIDVEGVHDDTAHRGFWFESGEGSGSVVRDLTIINSVAEGP